MTKRILAFTLCLVMICTCLFGCAEKDPNDLGAYITMFLTDDIYDFDPANAYYNSDANNVLSMMYDTLFKLDENGKVKKSLVDDYKIVENKDANEYYIEFTLKEAYWSVKDQLTAEDIVFAWKRLVDFRNNYDSASLLYDVKNARAIKEGDVSIDDLGVEAVENLVVKVSFDGPIDYDQFFLNLTSVATAPLLKRYVSTNTDWAKKGSTIATSGPFKLGKVLYSETGETVFDDNALKKDGTVGTVKNNKVKTISYFILERNSYYYRDTKRDDIDESVTPYRLLVDCTKTPDQLLTEFKENRLFYIGNIPLALRTGENAEFIKKEAEITNALSTLVLQLNENAMIEDGGTGSYLFANTAVRQALSMAIDRTAIANAIVFAEAATGLVAPGVFEEGTSGDFSTSKLAGKLLSGSANVAAAQALLTEAGITPSKYSFTIKVAAYDEVHITAVEAVAKAWGAEEGGLGFNVTVEKVNTIENNDYFSQTDSVPPDVCDDLFIENVQRGLFEVVAMDATAFSADAYSVLSNYAYAFSGSMFSDTLKDIYEYNPHMNGYDSVAYNVLIEAAYYIPYFANLEKLAADSYVVTHAATQPYVQSAAVALRKLSDARNNAGSVFGQASTDLNPTATEDGIIPTVAVSTVEATIQAISEQFSALTLASKQAVKNIVAAQADGALTTASQAASQEILTRIEASQSALNTALKDVEKAVAAEENSVKINKDKNKSEAEKEKAAADAAAALETALASAKAALTSAQNVLAAADAAVTAMDAVKNAANQKTLKELVKEIYDANGIVPSTKSSKWAEQRAILLHKAENLLMTDLPVIPLIFNKDAVIINTKHLSKVDSTYYAPAYFRKTKLKDYTDYMYYDAEAEKNESIFKKFPEIQWDKIGQ
ncbi:MAG: hypothetical protein E7620_08450 [Ruminococcaceae bacterium]|nr:hypothetical protein [Oscillospiraceae bacterium]